MPVPPSRLRPWRSALALAVLVVVAFQPTFTAGFVDWDDGANLVDNPHFRGFTAAHLAWMATSFHLGHYQPLAWLTLAADHALHGLEPGGYHVTNVLLHAATAVAFLAFARRLVALLLPGATEGRRELTAFAAAALFALHPLRVESVAWVTERRDVLSGLFFVLALDAWLRFRTEHRARARWAAFGWQLVSLLAKAFGVVLPALFLVLDAIVAPPAAGSWRARLRATAPGWVLTLAFSALALWAESVGTEAQASLAQHGLLERAVQAGVSLAFYPLRTLLPLSLSPHHALPPRDELLRAPWLLLAAAGFGLGTVAFLARRRAPCAWLAWLAFACTIAPVSGLLQVGPQIVAERYSYLACLPFALLLAGALCAPRSPPALATGLVAAVVLALVPMTRAQCGVWRDSEHLWARALAVDPENPTALGHAAEGDVARALELADPAERRAALAAALARFVQAFGASSNPRHLLNAGATERMLADTFEGDARKTRLDAALEHVEAAIALGERAGTVEPGWRRTHAALLADVGRDAEAERELAEVVRAIPGNAAARVVHADVLARLGRTAEALAEREAVCRLRPASSAAWRALGELRAESGARAAARVELERALALARAAGSKDDERRAEEALARWTRP